MNLPVYLAGLVFAVILAGGCLIAILLYLDPNSSNILTFILLYLSLLIALAGIFTLTGFLIRRISRRRSTLPVKVAINNLEVSFRQGILLSIIFVIALILQSQRVLSWWYVLVLLILITSVEWWLSRK